MGVADVRADHLDVAERERVIAYANAIAEHYGRVNLVFNNAGIAFTGTVEEMSFKDMEKVMDVDYWGVVNGTKAFLPHLIASGDGHVVNISSVFGIFAVPTQSAYHSAKFAVRGFTESLRQEMLENKRPVKVTCVHPGGIRTNIARNQEEANGYDHEELAQSFDRLARMSPEKAARVILRGVERGKARILVGADAYALDVMTRLLGPAYQRLTLRFSQRAGL
jgi:short-subunit dehydrogenase